MPRCESAANALLMSMVRSPSVLWAIQKTCAIVSADNFASKLERRLQVLVIAVRVSWSR